MKKRNGYFRFLTSACIILLNIYLLKAQPLEIGYRVGASAYLGDVAPFYPVLKETKLSHGGFLSYHFKDQYAVRGSFNRYRLSGSDANLTTSWSQNRNLLFTTSISETGIGLEYYLRRFNRCSKRLVPYVYAGIAYIRYNALSVNFAVNDAVDPAYSGASISGHSIAVPVGAGVKKMVYKGIALGAEVNATRSFTDQLDIPNAAGNPKRKDWYLFAGISVSYLFGTCNNNIGKLFPSNVDCFEFEKDF